jgi:dipeptidase D
MLAASRAAFVKLRGAEPKVTAIHAGLECGILGESVQGLDMVSMGPEIRYPHSPDECVQVSTVGPFYKLLAEVVSSLDPTPP